MHLLPGQQVVAEVQAVPAGVHVDIAVSVTASALVSIATSGAGPLSVGATESSTVVASGIALSSVGAVSSPTLTSIACRLPEPCPVRQRRRRRPRGPSQGRSA